MESPPDALTIQAWRPPVPGVREVLRASFAAHAYPPHVHDAWTLFIVDAGAIRYVLDRRERGAEPNLVSVLPPHIVHDGRAAGASGYRKRVIYLDPSVIGEHLVGAAVDQPAIPDPSLRREVAALHDALGCADDLLDAETRIAFVAERIRTVLGDRPGPAPSDPRKEVAEQLRAFLDDRLFEPVTLRQASEIIGRSETQLARSFVNALGLTPHAYVLSRRLEAARERILDGVSLADVAAETGFCDQAHLTRRFRRFLGTTPGRFAGGLVERAS